MMLGFVACMLLLAESTNEFDKRIGPIIRRRCLSCHNHELKDGGINFQDRSSLLKGGPHGPAIVPGKPEESYLVRAIGHKDDVRMPPGPKLPKKEIQWIIEWIRKGATWGTRPLESNSR